MGEDEFRREVRLMIYDNAKPHEIVHDVREKADAVCEMLGLKTRSAEHKDSETSQQECDKCGTRRPHYHEASDDGDKCGLCGLDLRNNIHIRQEQDDG